MGNAGWTSYETELTPSHYSLYKPTKFKTPTNEHFEHCMTEILVSYGSLVVDSLEDMRNEYVSIILHTAGDATNKEFSMRPEYEIIW
ncbi:uncharacterized protein OCT59_008043 [Rhizophagus irregularis]|uniref:uncharacterized protein n=1 Tax=Rhizophagus irregularis TaxID=588596 RepID=UPI003320984A|nr:hypothetical protein OCT59_008043 [Rhizophagus irregularis]